MELTECLNVKLICLITLFALVNYFIMIDEVLVLDQMACQGGTRLGRSDG